MIMIAKLMQEESPIDEQWSRHMSYGNFVRILWITQSLYDLDRFHVQKISSIESSKIGSLINEKMSTMDLRWEVKNLNQIVICLVSSAQWNNWHGDDNVHKKKEVNDY